MQSEQIHKAVKASSNHAIDDDGIDGNFLEEGIKEERAAASKQTLRLAEKAKKGQAALDEIRQEPDLCKRAAALMGGELVDYPDYEQRGTVSAPKTVYMNTPANCYALFDAAFGGENRPHLDTFSGRLKDGTGRFIDDHYSMTPLIRMLTAGRIKGTKEPAVLKSFVHWTMMEEFKRNDLIHYFEKQLPEWDGVSRAESKLIDLFDCDCKDEGAEADAERQLNRDFGRYFWLSIYMRITYPGCDAPMSIALFGGMNVGKSYFSKLICQTLTGDRTADSVPLDFTGDMNTFLRKITGKSIIANVGEMVGFSGADLNKVKDFSTRTSDKMDYKFEGHFDQQRQWIIVMDGNKYVGLQRDEDGNRRWFPMFVNQLPLEDGQRNWKGKGGIEKQQCANFENFEEDLWKIMAECREWLESNDYDVLKDALSKRVFEFNKIEKNNGRGIIRSIELDRSFVQLIKKVEVAPYTTRKTRGTLEPSRNGYRITSDDFARAYKSTYGSVPNERDVNARMIASGGEPRLLTDRAPGWFFPNYSEADRVKFNANNPLDQFLLTKKQDATDETRDFDGGKAKLEAERAEKPMYGGEQESF